MPQAITALGNLIREELPRMPLTNKGTKILAQMIKQYRGKKKGKNVFYASEKAGTIKGVHK